MATNKHSDILSLGDLRALLTVCRKLLAHSHPSAALMIEYAARDLQKQTDLQKHELKGRRKPKNGDREISGGDHSGA